MNTFADQSHTLLGDASRHAAQARHSAVTAARGIEPDVSERVAASASLVAAAAAAEIWIVGAHLATRVPLPREQDPDTGESRLSTTATLWRNLPKVARANGRPAGVLVNPWLLLFLNDLDTWYRALHHHSPSAVIDLQLRCADLGPKSAPPDFRDQLVAGLATTAVAVTTKALSWAHRETGLLAPDAVGQLDGAEFPAADAGLRVA